jgi:choice-of-anchor B domain-containing protein
MKSIIFVVVLFVLFNLCVSEKHCVDECRQHAVDAIMNKVMPLKLAQHEVCVVEGKCPTILNPEGYYKCENGMANEYPCQNVDQLSYRSSKDLGSNSKDGSDIWGWIDPVTGQIWAIANYEDGTSFVDITSPINPKPIAWLPTETSNSIWHDVKVYKDHAFIGSEAPNHGIQIVNLNQFKDSSKFGNGIVTIKADYVYTEVGSSHNVVINEDTGFLYIVGSRTCNGGLHIVDISEPLQPTFVGCFSSDGYTHDAQCVIYNGPDSKYSGHEICFNYNEDTLTIVDVSDKDNMKMLSRTGYTGSQYTHQGWLSEDHSYAVMNDELDEMYRTTGDSSHTRTMMWDITSLDNPVLKTSFYSPETAIDHNLYVVGKYVVESNYCAGLRILDISDPLNPEQVAYFDVAPDCDSPIFQGSWSAWPYAENGVIAVNSIERGLFVLYYPELYN